MGTDLPPDRLERIIARYHQRLALYEQAINDLNAAFLDEVMGEEVEAPDQLARVRADLAALGGGGRGPSTGTLGLRYEVRFLLEPHDGRIDDFRRRWNELGDSIVVAETEGIYTCRILTNQIGASIEAAVEAGRPQEIRITDLMGQAGDPRAHFGVAGFFPRPDVLEAPIGVVAVVAGPGLVEIFAELGVQGVVSGGASPHPSTEALLRVVEDATASTVVVLPNNKNMVPVAEQLDALSTKTVVVVPTRSIPQGIAAMLAYVPRRAGLDELVDDMAAAASSVVDGEITRAVRDATVDVGPISRGDWLAVADGTIVDAGPELQAVLRGLVASILPPVGAEKVTVFLGAEAEPSATKALEAWLSEIHPELDVIVVSGGQRHHPYLVSVE